MSYVGIHVLPPQLFQPHLRPTVRPTVMVIPNRKSQEGKDFFFGYVRGRFVCWNPPTWSFSLTARLTRARLHSGLRCRALHGCGCLGAKFQVQRCRRRLTRVETMKFQIGISEVLELEYRRDSKRESPRFPNWNFIVSTRVRRTRHRCS